MTPSLKIDFVSDISCPWCVIGYRQLAEALAATGTAHEIHWHPFELNPAMPAEGQNLREHVAEKYGATREELEAFLDPYAHCEIKPLREGEKIDLGGKVLEVVLIAGHTKMKSFWK